MCVKNIAECEEDVLLETVAIQDMQDRVFLFIRYLYPDETRPETRKRPKKWADLCKAKVEEPSRFFSIGTFSIEGFVDGYGNLDRSGTGDTRLLQCESSRI